MAKKGMKRPEFKHTENTVPPVPIINGRAKSGKEKANPLIAGTHGKVYHSVPHEEDTVPPVFPAIDNDLAVENLTNDFDMTAADLQDLLCGNTAWNNKTLSRTLWIRFRRQIPTQSGSSDL